MSYRPASFVLSMTVIVDGTLEDDAVVADVEAELRRAFGFESSVLGGAIFRSEIISCVQRRPSVIGVDLDTFDRATATPPENQSRLIAALPARGLRTGLSPEVIGAELLLLDERPLAITIQRAEQ